MIQDLLTESPGWANFTIFLLLASLFLMIILGFVTYAILAERKVMGFMQLRHGPNQVGGRWGLLQTVADVLKLLLKEDIIPAAADKKLFVLAPIIAFAPAFMVCAVLPFTDAFQFADIGVGLLYYIAVSGVSTVGIITGAWASNNKYALIGGMRAVAQVISYEIPLVMSVVGIILLTGSLSLNSIVLAQEGNVLSWFIVMQPIGFCVFFISAFAELNRTPFDLPEAESELVAGYHVEYSGFRWAFFMLSEYVYLFAMSALITILYLGGWWPPFEALSFIPEAVWFSVKFSVVVFIFVWTRSTLPRVKVDQLMGFAWKVLLPIALANIFFTAMLQTIFS